MPTRIDIELTSTGADGSWTWRAAGAREPRGVLDGALLPPDAAVGDKLKAETEHDIEGIRVLSVASTKPKAGPAGLLDLPPAGDFEPVTQQLARRPRPEGGRGRPRRDRDDRDDRGGRDGRGRRGGEGRDRRDGDPGRDRGPAPDRPPRRDGRPRDRSGATPDGAEGAEDRRRHRPHFTPPPELPQRPKPKRLRPGKQHRTQLLDTIPEEQRPVAELALQGMHAVRQRVHDDNTRLVAEGKPAMPVATVLKMAEEMLPALRVADWLDRAEAARRQLEHLDLRDLRSVVAASEDPVVARDEATRELAGELKQALGAKQDEELGLWLADVEANVDIGRVVRALRLSAMPPKAGVRFPAALGAKLATAATAALGPNDPPERWIAVLEAAAFAPVRSLVVPAGPPDQRGDELTATVTRLAPLLPQVAALFGVAPDPAAPAPKPLRPTPRRGEPPARTPGRAARPPAPPSATPPPVPPAAADDTPTEEGDA